MLVGDFRALQRPIFCRDLPLCHHVISLLRARERQEPEKGVNVSLEAVAIRCVTVGLGLGGWRGQTPTEILAVFIGPTENMQNIVNMKAYVIYENNLQVEDSLSNG